MSDKPIIFLCHPHNGNILPESIDAALASQSGIDSHRVMYFRWECSLLCNSFNAGVAEAKNNGAEYFALLHSDIVPSDGWLGQLLQDLNEHELDIIHAPVSFKDFSGLTSTAVAYSDSIWADKRRLTLKELANLPTVFTIDDVRLCIDERAEILLPNTGVLLMRCNDWFQEWSGFEFIDRVAKTQDGRNIAAFVPEDWLLGFAAHRDGLRVGASRNVTTIHRGRCSYTSDVLRGSETDERFVALLATEQEEAVK